MRDVAIKLNKLELSDGASACRSTVPTNMESSYCLRHCHATATSLLGFERTPLHRVQRREEMMSNEIRPRSRDAGSPTFPQYFVSSGIVAGQLVGSFVHEKSPFAVQRVRDCIYMGPRLNADRSSPKRTSFQEETKTDGRTSWGQQPCVAITAVRCTLPAACTYRKSEKVKRKKKEEKKKSKKHLVHHP